MIQPMSEKDHSVMLYGTELMWLRVEKAVNCSRLMMAWTDMEGRLRSSTVRS